MVQKLNQTGGGFTLREAHTIAVLALQRHWRARDWLAFVRDFYATVSPDALDWLFDIMGGIEMARGNGAASKTAQEGWTRFVDISLAGVTKDDISAEFGDIDAIGDAVDRLLRSGYRIGISFNGATNSYVASLTCRDAASSNAGCTVTSHAAGWWFVIQVMLYKHYVVAREDWTKQGTDGAVEAFG